MLCFGLIQVVFCIFAENFIVFHEGNSIVADIHDSVVISFTHNFEKLYHPFLIHELGGCHVEPPFVYYSRIPSLNFHEKATPFDDVRITNLQFSHSGNYCLSTTFGRDRTEAVFEIIVKRKF